MLSRRFAIQSLALSQFFQFHFQINFVTQSLESLICLPKFHIIYNNLIITHYVDDSTSQTTFIEVISQMKMQPFTACQGSILDEKTAISVLHSFTKPKYSMIVITINQPTTSTQKINYLCIVELLILLKGKQLLRLRIHKLSKVVRIFDNRTDFSAKISTISMSWCLKFI